MPANPEPPSDLKVRSINAESWSIPKRYVKALLACFGLFIVTLMRTSFHSAIFYIIVHDHHDPERGVSWNSFHFEAILSSFAWSIAISPIPGALLVIKYSSQRVLFVSMLLTTIIHFITPFFLRSNIVYIVIIQVLKGLFEGPIYPACIGIWQFWAPTSEKTRLLALVFAGTSFGYVAGFPLNFELSSYFGETACFFFSGICGLVWCMTWATQTYELPANDPHISHRELLYLEETVASNSESEVTVRSVPWIAMLKSLPVWAICIVEFCASFTEYILGIAPYSYYPIIEKHNTYFPSLFWIILPPLIIGVVVASSGFFADFLINRLHFPTSLVRKLYCSGALALVGLLLIGLKFCRDIVTAVICVHFAHGFMGLSLTGYRVSCFDISPSYASVVMALCNTFGGLGDILSVKVFNSSYLFEVSENWTAVFICIITMSFITSLVYAVCGSGLLQPWGKPKVTGAQCLGNEMTSSYYPYHEGEDASELVMDDDRQSNGPTE